MLKLLTDSSNGLAAALSSRYTEVLVDEYQDVNACQDAREEDTFTICLNSYRASGTGGYDFYVGCPVVREIGTEMADLILDCFKEFKGNIPAMQSDFRVI